jgi:hypothetical protein
MIQHIVNSTKDELNGQLRKRGLSANQSKDAMAMAKEIIQGSLVEQSKNAEELVTLLKSGTMLKSVMVKNMIDEFATKMSSKLGQSHELMAIGAANYIITLLISKVSNHVSTTGLDANGLLKQLKSGSMNPFKSFGKNVFANFF